MNLKAFNLLAFSLTVRSQPVKIVAVGDSITAGTGASDKFEKSWPGQLKTMFDDDCKNNEAIDIWLKTVSTLIWRNKLIDFIELMQNCNQY